MAANLSSTVPRSISDEGDSSSKAASPGTQQRAARERNLTHRKAIERQIRGDAQRRYERATSKMTKDELLINKKLLA